MPPQLVAAFAVFSLLAAAAVALTIRTRAGTFPAARLGEYSARTLFLASVTGLYLELLLIRWVSSEIRIFAYFKNFVLIACFLGFGIGFFLTRRAVSLATLLVPFAFLTLVVQLPWEPLRYLVRVLPSLLGASSEVQIWGIEQRPLDAAGVAGLAVASLVSLPLFAFIAIAFIPFGQIIGHYLESARSGIAAYSVNILGSLGGILLYTALSFLWQPPAVWFAVGGALTIALLWRIRTATAAAALTFAACALILLVPSERHGVTRWSPYQKLTLIPMVHRGELIGYELVTNASWYQRIVNLSPRFVAAHPELFRRVPAELNAFNLAYRFAPAPQSALIVGSGMGSDVAAALRAGARHVTAVDIDPMIVSLGRELHPENPYASERVETVIDDARSYLENSKRKFDVIVFAALDSHTTSSHFSNIRIDNYVYTVEALGAARRLLTEDGVLILRFSIERPWIAGRLYDLVKTTFGREPLFVEGESDVYATGGSLFVAGSPRRIGAALADPQFREYVRTHSTRRIERVPPATDDWPYFYQRRPGIPVSVVAISLLLLVVSFVAARASGLGLRSINAEFFLLGAGFMLLEAQIVSRTALLFGTTWVVNSVVIGVLLTLIVLANLVAAALPRFPVGAAYGALLAAVFAGWAIPLRSLFFDSFALRAFVTTPLLCLPVFFAGIVFIRRFEAASFDPTALGANLLGSLAGGILESSSTWLGLRALLPMAAAMYAAAWLAGSIRRRGAAAVEGAGTAQEA